MECLDVLNGGGWVVFIATNHFLVIASFSAYYGQSAPLVRTVLPCTSMTEIAMVSSNGYINGYKCI
jgi:hypothetical protein